MLSRKPNCQPDQSLHRLRLHNQSGKRDDARCYLLPSQRLAAWSMMKERGLQRIPVLDGARSRIGVIYTRDALQNLLGEAENEDELLRDYIAGVGYW